VKPNAHRESWAAWILCNLASLALFAILWFYLVFHRGLGLPLRQLVSPFNVLAFLQLGFGVAAKHSREKFINDGRILPLMMSVYSFILLLCLWFGYYARKFGYFNSLFALIWYIGVPIFFVLLGLLSIPLMPWMERTFMPREFRGER
jgi:hypothetical protein